jgi:hypothetical protein
VQLGVAEKIFDGYQFDALFQEQRGAGVSEVVEPDVADFGQVEAAQDRRSPQRPPRVQEITLRRTDRRSENLLVSATN